MAVLLVLTVLAIFLGCLSVYHLFQVAYYYVAIRTIDITRGATENVDYVVVPLKEELYKFLYFARNASIAFFVDVCILAIESVRVFYLGANF